MSQRKPKKVAPASKRPESMAPLRQALTRRKKAELVEVLFELAQADRGVLRQLTARFDVAAAPDELVAATLQAIADATAFDERDINRNFAYDYEAYHEVKRNLGCLIDAGQFRLAMRLALELMKQGSSHIPHPCLQCAAGSPDWSARIIRGSAASALQRLFFLLLDRARTIGCHCERTSLDSLLTISLCFSPSRRSHDAHLAWCRARRGSRQSGALSAHPAPARSARHRQHHRPPSATRPPTRVLPRPGPQLAAGRAAVPTHRLDQSAGLGGADRR